MDTPADTQRLNPEAEGGRNTADRSLYDDVDFGLINGKNQDSVKGGASNRAKINDAVEHFRSDGSRDYVVEFSKPGVKAAHTDYDKSGRIPTTRQEYAGDGKTLTRTVDYDSKGRPATVTNYRADGVQKKDRTDFQDGSMVRNITYFENTVFHPLANNFPKTQTEYAEGGKVARQVTYDGPSRFTGFLHVDYDQDGKTPTFSFRHKLNEEIRCTLYHKGTNIPREEWNHDLRSGESTKSTFTADGEIVSHEKL